MENMSEAQKKMQEDINQLNKRLDSIESKLNDKSRYSWENSIWILVPVAAIIMWGLTNIFN